MVDHRATGALRRRSRFGCASLSLAAALGLGGAIVAPSGVAAVGKTTEPISVTPAGAVGDGSSAPAQVSGDGRYVAFGSTSSNLVPGDTNNSQDVFVRDTVTGTTTRVSVATGGAQADKGGRDPSISKDGRFVAFESSSPDLIGSDANASLDVFVHDRQTGTTTRVSVADNENESNDDSRDPSISGDGSRIAFRSKATNLVGQVLPSREMIFVRDTTTGETVHVSQDTAGGAPTSDNFRPQISADGGHVAFASLATDLVPGDGNGAADVFVRDLALGMTTRASVDSAGGEAAGGSGDPGISDDGSKVVFESSAADLVPGDANGAVDVFVRDLTAGTTSRHSLGAGGSQLASGGNDPAISGDGTHVAFLSIDAGVVPGDGNGAGDVFVRAIPTGTVERVSVAADGAESQFESGMDDRALSTNGARIVFDSDALNFIPGDDNDSSDIFLRRPGDPPVAGGGAQAPAASGTAAGPSLRGSAARTCRGKAATIVGTPGNDVLRGTRRADVIVALGGRDRIIAGRGNDTICAGPGNDTVLAGLGRDVVLGQGGRDRLRGQRGRDVLIGGLGRDRLFGDRGNDLLRGGLGRDILIGGLGRDRMFGDRGRDLLRGGLGRDLGIGGPGRDRFWSVEVRRA